MTLDLTLGIGIGAPIIPQRGDESDHVFLDLSCKAIEDFNSQYVSAYYPPHSLLVIRNLKNYALISGSFFL